MKVGDTVKVKKEYCDRPEESVIIYRIVEDRGDSFLCRATNTNMPLPPHDNLMKEWVEVYNN